MWAAPKAAQGQEMECPLQPSGAAAWRCLHSDAAKPFRTLDLPVCTIKNAVL